MLVWVSFAHMQETTMKIDFLNVIMLEMLFSCFFYECFALIQESLINFMWFCFKKCCDPFVHMRETTMELHRSTLVNSFKLFFMTSLFGVVKKNKPFYSYA